MKRLVAVLLTLSANRAGAGPISTLFATPGVQQICSAVVQPAPDRGSGYWRLQRPRLKLVEQELFATLRDGAAFRLVAVKAESGAQLREVASFDEAVRDLAVAPDNSLWVLLSERVIQLDPVSGRILQSSPTHEGAPLRDPNQMAQSMAVVGQKLVIAHGTLGITVYDLAARTLVYGNSLNLVTADGYISKATQIVADGSIAWLAVEDVTVTNQPPYTFDGLIALNFGAGNAFAKRYEYDHRSSGWLANANLALNGDQIVINDWGILQLASKTSLEKSGAVQIRSIPTNVTLDGVSGPAELMGDVLIEDGRLFSCASAHLHDPNGGSPRQVGVVFQHGL